MNPGSDAEVWNTREPARLILGREWQMVAILKFLSGRSGRINRWTGPIA